MSAVETCGQVHQRIAELFRCLHTSHPTVDTAARRIVEYATAEIPGAHHADLTLASHKGIEVAAASDSIALALNAIEEAHREGPHGRAQNHQIVRITDLAADDRWPLFRREALYNTPVRSIVSFRLFTSNQPRSGLTLYADEPHAFDRDAEAFGFALATHAALALDAIRRDEQFHTGLETRDVIGQAKGILMARFNVDADAAFELLKRISSATNTRLLDVARRLAAMDRFDDLGIGAAQQFHD